MPKLACSSHMSCRWNEVFAANIRDWSLHCRHSWQKADQFCKEKTQLHSTGRWFVLQAQDQEEMERVFVYICVIPNHRRCSHFTWWFGSVAGAHDSKNTLPGAPGSGAGARDSKSPEYQNTMTPVGLRTYPECLTDIFECILLTIKSW